MVGKPFWEYRCGSCTAARQASSVLFAGGNPSPKSAGTDALLAVDFILARVLFLAVPAAPYRFRCRRAAVSIASTEHLHEFAHVRASKPTRIDSMRGPHHCRDRFTARELDSADFGRGLRSFGTSDRLQLQVR